MSKKQKQSTTSEPFGKEYKPYVYDAQRKVWGDVNKPATPYGGQLSTGVTGTQKSAIDNITSATNNQKLSDIAQGKYLDYTQNPTFMKSYQFGADKLNKQFGDRYDQVNTNFSRGIYNSNARKNAQYDAIDQSNDDLSQFTTGLIGQYEGQANNNMNNAISGQNQLNNTQLNAGNVEQDTMQQGLDKQYSEFMRQYGVDQQDLQNMMNVLGLMKSPQSQTTTSDGGKAAADTVGTLLMMGCFPAGVLVETKDGIKPIEQVKIGDYVLSLNADMGQIYAKVIRTMTGVKPICFISAEEYETEATPTQPFVTEQGRKPLSELVIGEEVLTNTGMAVIDAIIDTGRTETIYDIETDSPSHIFFANGFAVEDGFNVGGE
jgi:hypothetical protein